MQRIDCLIVGQGLAGTLLAWSLMQQGQTVHIIDNRHKHSSSMVAAGLVNPVTGKRLHKADDTEQCLESATSLYNKLAVFFEQAFYHPLEMMRLFTNPEQQQTLDKRLHQPGYAEYFGKQFSDQASLKPLHHTDGGVYQKKTGYLDIPALLTCLEEYFRQQKILHQEPLAYADLAVSESGVNWRDITADHCIFCEGYQATGNPWFKWLPFQLAKGEILTIKSDQIPSNHIVNRGNWLIPMQQGLFRTGSTNQWEFDDDRPTSEGRQQLEENLQRLFSEPPSYRVTDHQAGIRPATRDKKPFIGFHPEISQLAIFNGFGARGSMTIPFYAELFSKFVSGKQLLPADVDIRRYFTHGIVN